MSQKRWRQPAESAASKPANPLSTCLRALLNLDHRLSSQMALTDPGIPGSTPWRDKEADQTPAKAYHGKQREDVGRVCSPLEQRWSASRGMLLGAVHFSGQSHWVITIYHLSSLFSFAIFFPSNFVYFKFSSLVEKLYLTNVLQITGPTSLSKCFNNNHLFSVQRGELQPCGIFLHSLKSSFLSGEESVSDVNVALRVFKVFWSCLLSPQHGDKLRV